MRFHVLGVSFAPTNKEYSCEGFSQKVRLFCKMMTERGHIVYHYGIEGSDPICTENINVVSREIYEDTHKKYNYKESGFLYFSNTTPQLEFNKNAIIEIEKRKQKHDFLCFSFGFPQRPIQEAHPDLIDCEIGVGFDGSFANYRVFESYPWMNAIYSKEEKFHKPSFYDAVIPNYYDLNDYIFSEEKDDYFFFIARMDPLKGLEIALRSCDYVGSKLISAGTGIPHMTNNNHIHVGVVDFEQRAKLMSRAKATFITTNYMEPFGSTVLESLLCGTPVITTDFGAFSDTVVHGRVGYRCRTLEQFFWATKNINHIKATDCRDYAVLNNSIERIGEMYEEFFGSIYKLATNTEGWYQKNLNRANLNWLYKYIPNVEPFKPIEKPNLVFLVGYTPDLFNNPTKNDYGSEITLIKLAEQFSKKYNVFVFGESLNSEKSINNVEYLNIDKYEDFKKNNEIEITIVSRYIYHFLETNISSKKIYLWVHDHIILPYYRSKILPNNGIEFIRNILHKIDGIVALTEWHKNFLIDSYKIDPDKIFIIGSAIDPKMFKGVTKKQKNKFIWTSDGRRGINKLLEYFHEIRKRIPDAELYIYRDQTAFTYETLMEMQKYNYIHYKGKLENSKIIKEFENSEIWFYPTDFPESYCLSAVEAQMSKCICVTTSVGALSEIVSNRGVLINSDEIYSEEYKERCINEVVDILTNENRKKKYQEDGYNWAINQNWEDRAEKWYALFDKK